MTSTPLMICVGEHLSRVRVHLQCDKVTMLRYCQLIVVELFLTQTQFQQKSDLHFEST